jgi:prophage regulatory protein
MNYEVKFLRLNQVREITSLSKSTIYKMISEKRFPRQIQIGPQQVVWTMHDVQNWMNQKIEEAAL